jgi:hypothetical protein
MRDSTVHREGRAHNEFSKWVRIDKNEIGAVRTVPGIMPLLC